MTADAELGAGGRLRVVPLDDGLVAVVRGTLHDPVYGHPVQVETTPTGAYGPCRSCLGRTEPGERRILLLVNPFDPGGDGFGSQRSDFAGPVFLHLDACTPWSGDGVPEVLRPLPLLLRAYRDDGGFAAEARPGPAYGEVERAGVELLALPEVATVHLRNAEALCYVARLERQQGPVRGDARRGPPGSVGPRL